MTRFFDRDGIRFHYIDNGEGLPFFFQHGLGGDVSQPLGLFSPPMGVRFLALDARAHGETRPVGDPAGIALSSFADDLAALMDHLDIPRAVIGGISMGAAVALNFVSRYPARVLGLVLSRPAWQDVPFPEHLQVYPRIARLIRELGPRKGLERFRESAEFVEVAKLSPDTAQSLAGQFENARAEEAIIRLERIPRDAPGGNRDSWTSIRVPTLVLANRRDPIHPFVYGEELASHIPGAEFGELTPKSTSRERHAAEVNAYLRTFLQSRFLNKLNLPC